MSMLVYEGGGGIFACLRRYCIYHRHRVSRHQKPFLIEILFSMKYHCKIVKIPNFIMELIRI